MEKLLKVAGKDGIRIDEIEGYKNWIGNYDVEDADDLLCDFQEYMIFIDDDEDNRFMKWRNKAIDYERELADELLKMEKDKIYSKKQIMEMVTIEKLEKLTIALFLKCALRAYVSPLTGKKYELGEDIIRAENTNAEKNKIEYKIYDFYTPNKKEK